MTRMVQTHTLNPTFARPFVVHADTHILSRVLYSGDTPTHKAISWGDVQP